MSCKGNCQQGRTCNCRLYTLNTDGSDSDLQKASWRNLFHRSDALYTVVLIAGSAVLSSLLVYVVVWRLACTV